MSAPHTNLAAKAKDVFADALERPETERGAFLDGACAGDAQLRAVVDVLLVAHGSATGFMDLPSLAGPGLRGGAAAPMAAPPGEGPGAVVGRYKLLQLIGEGGFGSVFLAEQREPVVRRVALKIIKAGMDTKQVIARFEAERQALAMMDHPNIARVLDAGATESGRPYFVMELVRGDPITDYCDAKSLGVPQRLELFEQVCHAVQHAHQKGIVHRDIKPRNVLVTVADDKPIPKIIDFGIAKATSGRLTERTLFTEHRALIGTPEYMSPEQAEMSGVDIDTRSDIYSLGVLLYELLTGTTPFEPGALRAAAFGEIQRIIREVDPPRPSTRLSTMRDAIVSVAAHRQTEPARLPAQVRGDLDWMVMKCLEKDRTRRYVTAGDVAEDVRRHLSGEPVLAAPPGRAYRARKFVRRHRFGVGACAAVAAALLAGLAGTAIALVQARTQRDRAERIAGFMEDMLRGAGATLLPERGPVTLRDMVDDAAERISMGELEHSPEAELRLRLAIGGIYRLTRAHDAAEAMIGPALPLARSLAGSAGSAALANVLTERASLLMAGRRVAEAEPLFAEALEIRRRLHTQDHSDLVSSLQALGHARWQLGRDAEVERLFDEEYQMRRRLGHAPALLAESLLRLASVRLRTRPGPETTALFEEALAMFQSVLKGDRAELGIAISSVGVAYESMGRHAEAETMYQRALDMFRRVYGGEHKVIAATMADLGRVKAVRGGASEAETLLRGAAEMAGRIWPTGDTYCAHRVLTPWAAFLHAQGRTDEAKAVITNAVKMATDWPPGYWRRRDISALAAELGVAEAPQKP